MRVTTIFKPLALMATLLTIDTMAAPVAEPTLNTTGAVLVERNLAPALKDHRDLRLEILDMHNAVRELHHAPPLVWNTHLAAYAQRWANKCTLDYSMGPYGENIVGVGPAGGISNWTEQTKESVNAWINECELFPWSDPRYTSQSGHFSQMVWVGSKEVGCAWNTNSCDGDESNAWLVCEFLPVGNVKGYFVQNVLPISA